MLFFRKSKWLRLCSPKKAFLLIVLMWLSFNKNVWSISNDENGPNVSSIVHEIRFSLKSINCNICVPLNAPGIIVEMVFACKSKCFSSVNDSKVFCVMSVRRFDDISKFTIFCVNSQQFLPMVWIELLAKFNFDNMVMFSKPSLWISVNLLLDKSLCRNESGRNQNVKCETHFAEMANAIEAKTEKSCQMKINMWEKKNKHQTYSTVNLSRPRKTPVINSLIELLRNFKLVNDVKLLNIACCKLLCSSLLLNDLFDRTEIKTKS